jgi:hypothetical protein
MGASAVAQAAWELTGRVLVATRVLAAGSTPAAVRALAAAREAARVAPKAQTICPTAVVVLGVQKAAIGLLDLPFIG